MVITGIKRGLEILSGLLLIVLMAITGIDVIGRYVLDMPLPGAFEMTELLLGALIFAALPLVGLAGSHVEVDLFVDFLPQRLAVALLWGGGVVSGVVLIFFGWRLGILGRQQLADGARSISLAIPFAPLAFFGAICCGLAAVFGILRARSE